MKILVKKALIKDKPLLKKLMRPYLKELSKFIEGDINDDEYKYLDLYWKEEERVPFLVYEGKLLCGFVLVNNYCRLSQNKGARAISEFYIIPKNRGLGIGSQVATWIFNKFPGKWEVDVVGNNVKAVNFWEKTINNYTNGKFTKVVLDNDLWEGPIYSFSSK